MYWDRLLKMVQEHEIVIDRPKGTNHPRYTHVIYPLDYGYLAGTTTIDGEGIDIFIGSENTNKIKGIICTIDTIKNDAEIKIMYNCSDRDIDTAIEFLNNEFMSAVFISNNEW